MFACIALLPCIGLAQTTLDQQEQRERAQREAQARQQQRATPDVRLTTSRGTDFHRTDLPAEQPCFRLDSVRLEGPHLADFGLARRERGECTLTTIGQVLGTPAYMSPEQARGEAHRVDGRSDLYSLGVVFYEVLTGELPFRGNTRMLLAQVLEEEPRSPRRLNDGIPRDLETICLKCLQKEPHQRYASARVLAEDLRLFLKEMPITIPGWQDVGHGEL